MNWTITENEYHLLKLMLTREAAIQKIDDKIIEATRAKLKGEVNARIWTVLARGYGYGEDSRNGGAYWDFEADDAEYCPHCGAD